MTHPADKLMQALVTLAVSHGHVDRQAICSKLDSVDAPTWSKCLVRLDEHRLMPLVYFGLARADCLEKLPSKAADALRSQFDYSRIMNAVRWLSLRGLVRRLSDQGITPTVCKGMVLAQRYYPDPATRHMNDVDLWIARHELERARTVLGEMGFIGMPAKELPDGGCYQNSLGVIVDLHHRMRLFEPFGQSDGAFTEPYEPGGFRVHEPHALIAHLVGHFEEHRSDTGPMLCWLIDLGYVVRRDAHRLDLQRLKELVSKVASYRTLLATLRLLNDSFAVELPEPLLALTRDVEAPSLAEVLRQRRLALWGLPGPRGWARLLVASLRPTREGDRPMPTPSDLVSWPFDLANGLRRSVMRTC